MPAKLTHEIVKQFYIDEKWELLEDVYINNYTKMKCKCPNGHLQYKRFNDFKNGSRCPTCSGCQKPTIEFVKEFALKDKTKCKSDKYINAHSKLLFECPEGHEYEMTWGHFQNGHRCAECVGVKKPTIEFIKNLSLKDGTKCKSNNYINNRIKLLFECKDKHEYYMTYHDFQSGHRCPACKSIKYSGNNNPSWNPNREQLPLNRKLRCHRKNSWIKKQMKHDSNYNDFVYNPKNYHLDHIIPVKLFCELVSKYNLDETKIRKIINKVDNLQLLTIEENYKKKDKGDINEAKQYLIEHGIQLE